MTDQEVNRIIAEFMGITVSNKHSTVGTIWKFAELPKHLILDFTESLDALVPVWEKLYKENFVDTIRLRLFDFNDGDKCAAYLQKNSHSWNSYSNDCSADLNITIQQAAAHATAKAIKEINNGK